MVAVGAAKAMKTLASNDLFTGIFLPFHFGNCSCVTSARLRSRMRIFGYCWTAASNALRAMIGWST
jgi:hypothetical protein